MTVSAMGLHCPILSAALDRYAGFARITEQDTEVVRSELEITLQPPSLRPRIPPHAYPALALADQSAQEGAVAAHDLAGRDDVAVGVGVHHPAHPVHADDDRAVR